MKYLILLVLPNLIPDLIFCFALISLLILDVTRIIEKQLSIVCKFTCFI